MGEPGQRFSIIDDIYDGLAFTLTRLAYADEPPLPLEPPRHSRAIPPPEPGPAGGERRELALEGGMMGGGGMMDGMMRGMGGMMGMGQATWSINGTSMTGDGHAGMAPLFTLGREKSHLVTIRNRTAWWHPMHLHGFSFKVLTRLRTTRGPTRYCWLPSTSRSSPTIPAIGCCIVVSPITRRPV